VIENFQPTCKFLARTLAHKWYVLRAGLRTKAPLWRLIIHDWTKFTPSEAPHYGRQQYGSADDAMGFAQAWNHHHKSNRHHWEWYIPLTPHRFSTLKGCDPLPMPESSVREMVADWLGASRVHDGFWQTDLAAWAWLHRERPNMRLHADTQTLIDRVLAEYFSHPIA